MPPPQLQMWPKAPWLQGPAPDLDLIKLPPMLAEHDGLAYFAHHTGLRIAQIIHKYYDTTPSIRDISDLQTSVEQEAITCVLSDPGSDGRLLSTIFGAKGFSAVPVVIRGDGQNLGPPYYRRLLTELAAAIQSCTKG
jgi:ABC-type Zn2+ transport system substrate-binding protein/surface adhesin